MDLTQEDVLKILNILDESSFEQLHLEQGAFKLVVNKGNNPGSSTVMHHRSSSEPEPEEEISRKAPSDMPAKEGVMAQDEGMMEVPDGLEGLIPIRSPMLGTFYRSPKPEDPPFVEEEQMVDDDTTICIIEVMKLFSTIHAGVTGRIAKICANDGQLVEYNQVLFLVDPGTDDGES